MNLVELDHALRKLRLSGMADALETRLRQAQSEKQTPIDLVSALVGDELVRRQDRLITRRLQQARFRDPDRTLDLHGMTLDTAWQAIDRGLEHAIARGGRVVLLITGHHRPGDPPVQRGKIRAAVHDWLAASRHAGSIAAVRGSHRRHDGGGSLYLVLRRR